MTQKQIAGRLKVLTGFLGVAGLPLFALIFKNVYMAYYALSEDGVWDPSRVPEQFRLSGSHVIPMFIVLLTMVMCYLVLHRFYMTCTEIGRDNSFSMENVHNFAVMKVLMLITGGVWTGYTIGLVALQGLVYYDYVAMVTKYGLMAIVFFTIAAFADALSRLIQRAYEIREENELTI